MQRSLSKKEIVVKPGDKYRQEEFPHKNYIRFLKSIPIYKDDTVVHIEESDDKATRDKVLNVFGQEMKMHKNSQNSFSSMLGRKFSLLVNSVNAVQE